MILARTTHLSGHMQDYHVTSSKPLNKGLCTQLAAWAADLARTPSPDEMDLRSKLENIAEQLTTAVELATAYDELQVKIGTWRKFADEEWRTFNAAKADREEWRKGYHAAIAERNAAHAKIKDLEETLKGTLSTP